MPRRAALPTRRFLPTRKCSPSQWPRLKLSFIFRTQAQAQYAFNLHEEMSAPYSFRPLLDFAAPLLLSHSYLTPLFPAIAVSLKEHSFAFVSPLAVHKVILVNILRIWRKQESDTSALCLLKGIENVSFKIQERYANMNLWNVIEIKPRGFFLEAFHDKLLSLKERHCICELNHL